MGIFIIDVVVGFGTLIKFVVFAQSFVIRYRRVQRLPSRKRRFELCSLLRGLSFAKSKGATVKVIPSLASLSSLHKNLALVLEHSEGYGSRGLTIIVRELSPCKLDVKICRSCGILGHSKQGRGFLSRGSPTRVRREEADCRPNPFHCQNYLPLPLLILGHMLFPLCC